MKPGLDDKILTAWNALMISAYADAYQVFGKKDYLQKAVKAAEFIQKKMMNKDYALKRSYKDGNAKIKAFSDDYALSSEAFIKLYQVSGDENYLMTAKKLTDYLLKHFYDKSSGMFFYTSDNDAALTVRQNEISDNVIPSSNSVIAKNLYMLGLYFTDELYSETAKRMIAGMEENTLSNINYFAGWASLNLHFSKPSYELVIIGKDYKYFAQELLKSYRPDIIFAGSKKESNIPIFKDRYKEGETLIYVCKNNVCNQPVKTLKEAIVLLK